MRLLCTIASVTLKTPGAPSNTADQKPAKTLPRMAVLVYKPSWNQRVKSEFPLSKK
jgi:hypothetical protein